MNAGKVIASIASICCIMLVSCADRINSSSNEYGNLITPGNGSLSQDEESIIRLVLDYDNPNQDNFLIYNTSIKGHLDTSIMKLIKMQDSGFTKQIIEKYNEVNKESVCWDTVNINLNKKYYYIDSLKLNKAFDSEGGDPWDSFHKAYPNSRGYYQLSKIVFQDDSLHAIVSYAHWYGLMGGDGGELLFVKKDGKWKNCGAAQPWVS